MDKKMTYYDEIADGYELLHGEEQKRKYAIIAPRIALLPDMLMLDVGCGSALARPYFKARYVGLDPSFRLLENQGENMRELICGKAESLPFADKVFDLVISVTAMHNFEDISLSLGEMKRVGKKHAVISVLKKSNKLKLIEALIANYFAIWEKIEEEKDIIYFCTI